MSGRREMLKKVGMAGAALVATIGTAGVAEAKSKHKHKPKPPSLKNLRVLLRNLATRVRHLAHAVRRLANGRFDVGVVQISDPAGRESTLVFGESGECAIGINQDGPPGLLLRDPDGARLLTTRPEPENAVRAAASVQSKANGVAFVDSFFDIDVECRGRMSASYAGMSFDEASHYRFTGGEIQALSLPMENGEFPPGGIAFLTPKAETRPGASFDSFFDIDVECRGRASATADGMFFEEASSYQFRGGEIQAVSTMNDTGDLVPGGIAFGDSFFDIDVECRGRVAADEKGMNFDEAPQFNFSAKVVAPAFETKEIVQVSSGHLKENVRPIDNALAKIGALQGVYFDWKAEQGGCPDVGFIAEDVNDVIPELVGGSAGGGAVTGVKYGNMVAVAVEGIKAQQTEIERLTSDNATLRERMDSMQARLDALAARSGSG